MADKATVEVRVAKAGPSGQATASVYVNDSITSAQLGSALQKVVTNEQILRLGGLKACGGCKSGLDIHVLGNLGDVVRFEV